MLERAINLKRVTMPIASFLISAKAPNMFFNPTPPTELEFETLGTPTCLIRLRHKDGETWGRGLEVQCRAAFDVSEWEREFVSAQLERRYLASETMPIKLPYRHRGETHIEADGSMRDGFGIPFEFFPPNIQALCSKASEHLTTTLSRFLKLLRWEQASPGTHVLYDHSPALYWGLSLEGYHQYVPGPRHDFESRALGGLKWNPVRHERMTQLWSMDGVEEPLAHELLREAHDLARGGSPRSALLIAISAIETGLKNHISHHVKGSGWFVENAQSPPVYKILRDYIPIIHASDDCDIKWDVIKPLAKKLQGYIELRNKLTHTGRAEFGISDTFELIELVSDVLYVLDVLAGHAWARNNVSPALARELGWDIAEGKGMRIRSLSPYPLVPRD